MSEEKISIVVPMFFSQVTAPHIRNQFEDFFGQFVFQEWAHVEIFLSDSGPIGCRGPVERVVSSCLEALPGLCDRVHYHYEVTDGPPLSRAEAMNLGVQRTSGEIVLFLHLDCQLPMRGLAMVMEAFGEGVCGGGFLKVYTQKAWLSPLLLTEQYLNWLRTWWGRHLVGTNAIFLERALAIEHPYRGDFLEDVELSDWMRERVKGKRWRLILVPVEVSARKYYKLGVWPSIAINASVMGFYRLFAREPGRLKRELYHRRFPEGWRFWPSWSKAVFSLFFEPEPRD